MSEGTNLTKNQKPNLVLQEIRSIKLVQKSSIIQQMDTQRLEITIVSRFSVVMRSLKEREDKILGG